MRHRCANRSPDPAGHLPNTELAARVTKVWKECHARGRSQRIYFERLAMQLPGVSRRQIESHDRWWHAWRFYQQQRRDITQSFERQWEEQVR